MIGGGSSADRQSSGFGIQGSGATYSLGANDPLRWVEQPIMTAKKKKLSKEKTEELS